MGLRKALLIFAFALALPLSVPPPAFSQTAAQDLVSIRGRYGALVSRAQLGAILNEVAWKHKDEGFGLLAKSAGNVCPQPRTGRTVSCDWLVNRKTGRAGDVMGSATNDDGSPAPGNPSFNQSETFSGTFVEPVEPEDGGTVEPPPPPPPTTDIIRAFQAVSVKLDMITNQLDAIAQLVANQPDLRSRLAEINDSLILLKVRPVEFPVYKGRVLGQPFTLTPQK